MAFEIIKKALPKLFGAPEQKSLVAPFDAWGLDAFLAPATISNVQVNPQTAMRVPAVSLAVNLIAGAIGSLPARIVRDVEGSKEAATDHPAYRLVARNANDRTTAGKLREKLAFDALTRGNGFAFANRVNGRVVEIVRLDPSAVSVQLVQASGEALYRSTIDGKILDPAALIHIPAPVSFDGVTGISPITLAREAIAVAITLEARAARLFGISARPAGIIEVPEGIGEDELRKMRSSWEAAQGGAENSGKTPVLFGGAKFHPLPFDSVHSQFIESRKEQTVEIARAFGVPATMLQELSGGTFNNSEQQALQFIKFTLAPWVSTFKGEFERALLSDDERDELSIELDTDALIAIDTAARTDRIAKLRGAGVLTANDARRDEGFEALPDGNSLSSPHTTAGTPSGQSVNPSQGQDLKA